MKTLFNLNSLIVLILASVLLSCKEQPKTEINQDLQNLEVQTETNTKKLLSEFLVNENMENLSDLLNDNIKFHWPDKTVLDKKVLWKPVPRRCR